MGLFMDWKLKYGCYIYKNANFVLCWYGSRWNLPNKEERGYSGLGKSEAVVDRFSQISKENICVGVSFFSKVAGFQLYYKRLQHRCFSVKFAKFLRTFFYRIPPVAASGKSI